jgi:predicted RNA-binding protein with PUA-like domain
LQATERYQLSTEIPRLLAAGDWWVVRQHLKKLRSGDFVLLWQSGNAAGLYGIGEIRSEPYQAGDDTIYDQNADEVSEGIQGGEYRIDVSYVKLIEPPLLAADFKSHPTLGNLDVLRRPWSANPFAINDDEWSALKELMLTDHLESLNENGGTAVVAANIHGDKLYQQRARAALPLLVRQAFAGTPILYSDLANELGMANPRNLNYVLGSIGKTLEGLSQEWGEKVPPIQCLVINKQTGLPGAGIGWFFREKGPNAIKQLSDLTLRQQREMIQAELLEIYSYSKWIDVLNALSLQPSRTDVVSMIEAASGEHGSGEESPQHKALKDFVARHPEIVGLSKGDTYGKVEHPLPSGDCLDVSFERKNIWVAAEVKSSISNDADLVRGLFQCVKYLAVMEAKLIANSRPANARVCLVLERSLPHSLVPLKNLLGIEVIEQISPSTELALT